MAVSDELSVFCRNFFGLILTDLPLSSESYLSFSKSNVTQDMNYKVNVSQHMMLTSLLSSHSRQEF